MNEVSICNTALSYIGATARLQSIDPNVDKSIEAFHCSVFYPLAREVAVARHTWAFATRRARCTRITLSDEEALLYPEWPFAYMPPADCLRPVEIINPLGLANVPGELGEFRFETRADGSKAILTKANDHDTHRGIPDSIVLRYVAKVYDPARWPALFADYLALEVAARIAGPLKKSPKGSQGYSQMAREAFVAAAGNDSNQDQDDRSNREYLPDWIKYR